MGNMQDDRREEVSQQGDSRAYTSELSDVRQTERSLWVGTDDRKEHGKLVDPARLQEMLDQTPEPEVPDTALVIDTSTATISEAATVVSEALLA